MGATMPDSIMVFESALFRPFTEILQKDIDRTLSFQQIIIVLVTLQQALLSDLDKGDLECGKDASAPRCLARPGNTATNNEWRLSPNGWKDEQRIGRWTEVASILL